MREFTPKDNITLGESMLASKCASTCDINMDPSHPLKPIDSFSQSSINIKFNIEGYGGPSSNRNFDILNLKSKRNRMRK